jgi:hypothetical protein
VVEALDFPTPVPSLILSVTWLAAASTRSGVRH